MDTLVLHHFDSPASRTVPTYNHEPVSRVREMAPRHADPIPNPGPAPDRGPVGGFGVLLNYTTAAEPFTYGLAGVNQVDNYLFVNITLALFLGLLGVTLAYRWVHMAYGHTRLILTMGSRGNEQRYWMWNHTHFWPKVKRELLYAPLGKVRHNRELRLSSAVGMGTIPSRFHALLLTSYLLLNLAWCLAMSWHTENENSVIAELRGRSGTLAVFNLIPTVLFALRNNPLIHITGVSYDTFNLLHRWCARVVIVEATLHTICWGVNSLMAGGMYEVYVSLSTSTSYCWGMVGTCMFAAVLIQSLSPVRHAFYETFLNLHRILVLMAIVGAYIHLDKANLPQLSYIQMVIAFWLSEWAWRFSRLLYFNVNRQSGVTKITVEALPAEACRVTFDLARPWRWEPGCHVHAYIPTVSLWSSHPFSVAWAENKTKGAPTTIEMEDVASAGTLEAKRNSVLTANRLSMATPTRHNINPSDLEKGSMFSGRPTSGQSLKTIVEQTHKQESTNIALTRDAEVTSISLVMRARTGMTKKLFDKASASPTREITTWGAIEGPYGGHDPMTSYGTVVLFAGGVGITHCVGYIHHLLLRYQAGTTSTQKMLLVWSVPNTEALEWVRKWMNQILRMEGRREVLRIQLYVTKPRHRGEVISNTGSVQMFPGRCNPETVMKKEFQERIGSMGVTVCGPGAFADSVRAAVRQVVERGPVDFIEEAFTY